MGRLLAFHCSYLEDVYVDVSEQKVHAFPKGISEKWIQLWTGYWKNIIWHVKHKFE